MQVRVVVRERQFQSSVSATHPCRVHESAAEQHTRKHPRKRPISPESRRAVSTNRLRACRRMLVTTQNTGLLLVVHFLLW